MNRQLISTAWFYKASLGLLYKYGKMAILVDKVLFAGSFVYCTFVPCNSVHCIVLSILLWFAASPWLPFVPSLVAIVCWSHSRFLVATGIFPLLGLERPIVTRRALWGIHIT